MHTDRTLYFRIRFPSSKVWSRSYAIDRCLYSLKARFNKHRAERVKWGQFSQRTQHFPPVYLKRSWSDENPFRGVEIFCNLVILNKTGLLLRYNDNASHSDGFGESDLDISGEDQTNLLLTQNVPIIFDSKSNSLMVLPYGTQGVAATRDTFVYGPYTVDGDRFRIVKRIVVLSTRGFADGDEGDTITEFPISLDPEALSLQLLQTYKRRQVGGKAKDPIVFKIAADALVFVCYPQDSGAALPQWVSRLGFQDIGAELGTRRVKYQVLRKFYKSHSKVILGDSSQAFFILISNIHNHIAYEPFVSDPDFDQALLYFQYAPFSEGDLLYHDDPRTVALKIPAVMYPQPLLLLRRLSKDSSRSRRLRFDIHQRSKVFLCFDTQLPRLPSWLEELGFISTFQTLKASDVTFDVYRRVFDAGRITLGPSTSSPSPSCEFLIIVAHADDGCDAVNYESDVTRTPSEGFPNSKLHQFWDSSHGDITTFPPNLEVTCPRWSRPFNITENNKGEVLSSGCALSARVQSLMGVFRRSRSITLLPRFILINKLPCAIQFSSFCSLNFERLPQAAALQWIPKHLLGSGCSCAVYQFPPPDETTGDKYGMPNVLPFISVERVDLDFNEDRVACPICLNKVGEQYFWFDAPETRKIIVSASIMAQGTVFSITLAQAEIFPYRIENRSHRTMFYRQYRSECSWELLDSMKWHSFIWANPFIDDKLLEVSLGIDSDSKTVLVDLSSVGIVANLTKDGSSDLPMLYPQNVRFEVKIDLKTRVLRAYDVPRAMSIDFIDEEEMVAFSTSSLSHSMKLGSNMLRSINLSNISAHLIVECIYLRLADECDVIGATLEYVCFRFDGEKHLFNFDIYHVQVDDLSSYPKFPVVFSPFNSGRNSHLSKNKSKRRNFIEITLKSTPSNGSVYCLEYVDIQIGEISMKVWMELVWKLIALVGKTAHSERVIPPSQQVSLKRALETEAIRSILDMTVSDRIYQSSSIFTGVQFYLGKFHHGAIVVHTEIFVGNRIHVGLGDTDRSLATGFAVLGGPMLSFISSVVGSIAHASPVFIFEELLVSNFFGDAEKLLHMIYTIFNQQAFAQAYKLFGSLELIGNPLSFIDNIKTGVTDFYCHTIEEMEGSASTRGEGVRRLAYSVIIGTFGSASKVTGSLADISRVVSGKKTGRALNEDRPDTIAGGLHHGGLAVVRSLERGVIGLVEEPRRGLHRDGLFGVIKGLGKGFVRLLASPITGVLDAVTVVAESVENQALSVDGKPVDRLLRRIKPVDGISGALSESAIIQAE